MFICSFLSAAYSLYLLSIIHHGKFVLIVNKVTDQSLIIELFSDTFPLSAVVCRACTRERHAHTRKKAEAYARDLNIGSICPVRNICIFYVHVDRCIKFTVAEN